MSLNPKFVGQKFATGITPQAIHSLELCTNRNSLQITHWAYN